MVGMTMGAVLEEASRRHGGRTAYVWDGGTMDFAAFHEATRRLAGGLLGLGLVRGDRIGIIAPNGIEWLLTWFAATQVGLVVVGLSVRYRASELVYFTSDAQMKAVVSVRSFGEVDYARTLADVARAAPCLRHVILIGAQAGGTPSFESLAATPADDALVDAASAAVQPSDLAMVIYTSGTTGRPKGAGLSHRSLLGAARAQLGRMGLEPGDYFPGLMPFNHVGGITCSILNCLLAGACCELVPVFKTDAFFDSADRHTPSVMGGVPTMLKLLFNHPRMRAFDGARVRAVYVGGSAVDHELLTAARVHFPRAQLFNLYGMSEASGALIMTPVDAAPEDVLRFVGTAIPGVSARVVTLAGQPAAPGEVGELRFKGPGVMEGYISGAAAQSAFDDEGWLMSGDLGSMDERGFIELKGRLKEMYIQGGFNVYPVEVENVIASHPKVMLVAGIGVPDPVLGEVGRYYIVPRPGSDLAAGEIVALCAEQLADYKVPRQVVLRDSLPLTPAGKIHKAVLKEEFAGEQAMGRAGA